VIFKQNFCRGAIAQRRLTKTIDVHTQILLFFYIIREKHSCKYDTLGIKRIGYTDNNFCKFLCGTQKYGT